ncbi:MAG: acetyltransferase [Nostoc sp.]|uniref:acetyltransferase n=1 Tax=Nostoc sp. TaxID=1180 RepID=UPI002FFCF3A8
MEQRCILVGAGAFGRELINWVYDAQTHGIFPPLDGFISDIPNVLDGFDYKLTWLGQISTYQPTDRDLFLLGIGDPKDKESLVTSLKNRGGKFITLIHPTAVLARTARLGEGVILCPFSVISADATIGNFVTFNCFSGAGHDVQVGDYTTVSSHVDLTGGVKCGHSVFFGTGAKVLPHVSIGNSAKIGAGALIVRTVTEGSTMFAAPARKL